MIEKRTLFARSEDGAVTVDWVVLTAAVVGIAVVAWVNIKTETTALSERTAVEMSRKAQALDE